MTIHNWDGPDHYDPGIRLNLWGGTIYDATTGKTIADLVPADPDDPKAVTVTFRDGIFYIDLGGDDE